MWGELLASMGEPEIIEKPMSMRALLELMRELDPSPDSFRISPNGRLPPEGVTLADLHAMTPEQVAEYFDAWFGRMIDQDEAWLLMTWPFDERDAYASPVRH